jgi:hypothetical protein
MRTRARSHRTDFLNRLVALVAFADRSIKLGFQHAQLVRCPDSRAIWPIRAHLLAAGFGRAWREAPSQVGGFREDSCKCPGQPFPLVIQEPE